MSTALKVLIFIAIILAELGIGVYLWRKFTNEGKPQLASLLAAQAAATVVIVAVILFVLL